MYGHKKIYIEHKTENEAKEVSLTLKIVFQGVPYPDPDQDVEAEKEAKKAGKKDKKGAVAEEEPEIRMLTPDPVTLEAEHGRHFVFEVGKYVKMLSPDHTEEEVKELKEKSEEIPEDFYI